MGARHERAGMRRLLILLLMVKFSWAATGETVELTCPVCANKVQAVVLTSYDTEAGVDRDMMEWSRGGSPLFLQPVTCTVCTYSAKRASGFELAVPQAVLQQLESRTLPQHDPITPNSELRVRYTEGLESNQTVPVWIRLELFAQQREWESADALERAGAWLEVAWATRLEINPFAGPLEKVPDGDFLPLFARVEDPETNQAVEEVKLAREMLQALSEGEKGWRDLVLAGFMLRRHGEFPDLERHMEVIETRLGEDFRADLETSIEREKKFLGLALKVLDDELIGQQVSGAPAQPVLHYLSGELCRRLGQTERARERYQEALNSPELPEEMRPWAREQLESLNP